MTHRQLARTTRHLLAWTPPTGIGVQFTVIPVHGAVTVALLGSTGAMQLVTLRAAMNRRQTRAMLDNIAADLTPCSCPFCRSQAVSIAQATQIMNRPRIDPMGYSGVN